MKFMKMAGTMTRRDGARHQKFVAQVPGDVALDSLSYGAGTEL